MDMSQEFTFDKFMDDLLEKEAKKVAKNEQLEKSSDTPQREYIRKYRETPHNRIRVSK